MIEKFQTRMFSSFQKKRQAEKQESTIFCYKFYSVSSSISPIYRFKIKHTHTWSVPHVMCLSGQRENTFAASQQERYHESRLSETPSCSFPQFALDCDRNESFSLSLKMLSKTHAPYYSPFCYHTLSPPPFSMWFDGLRIRLAPNNSLGHAATFPVNARFFYTFFCFFWNNLLIYFWKKKLLAISKHLNKTFCQIYLAILCLALTVFVCIAF